MIIRDERREVAIARMASHLLKAGLGDSSLRTLAKAAGTSDRMLLYYFRDKNELLAATLARIAGQMAEALDQAIPAGKRLPREALLQTVWAAVSRPAIAPYMNLWLDLAAGAARGDAVAQLIGGPIVDGFLQWIADRLAVQPGEDGEQVAALLLATIDGLLLLNAVGRKSIAAKAVAPAAAGKRERKGRGSSP